MISFEHPAIAEIDVRVRPRSHIIPTGVVRRRLGRGGVGIRPGDDYRP